MDLHGLIVSEALFLVGSILEGTEPLATLKLITGRGKHSIDGVGRIKIAVEQYLLRQPAGQYKWEWLNPGCVAVQKLRK